MGKVTSINYHLLTTTSGWIFQQDNATCHTSRLVREWFNDEQITVMDWPAQSPDFNPIENLWDQIKTMVQEQNPTSVKELWTAINSAWEGFPSDQHISQVSSCHQGQRRAY